MNSLSQRTLCPNEHFVPTNSLSQRNLSQRIICPDERFVPTNYVSRRIMCSLGERVRRDEPLVSLIISCCGGVTYNRLALDCIGQTCSAREPNMLYPRAKHVLPAGRTCSAHGQTMDSSRSAPGPIKISPQAENLALHWFSN